MFLSEQKVLIYKILLKKPPLYSDVVVRFPEPGPPATRRTTTLQLLI